MADRSRDHTGHDIELVARAAAGDLAASEAIAARDLLASCAACAHLAADLSAIATATRTLPDAAARSSRVQAPKDFRLSAADAARLRPRGLPGLARRFMGLGSAFGGGARALGGSMATLGLVGLLVSAALPTFFMPSAGGAASTDLEFGGPTKLEASVIPAAAPGATGFDTLATANDGDRAGSPEREVAGTSASPWPILAGISIVVAVAGFVLLGVGRRSRRLEP